MKYHLTPVRMVIIKKKDTASVDEDMEKRRPLCTVDVNIKWYSHYAKQYKVFSKN